MLDSRRGAGRDPAAHLSKHDRVALCGCASGRVPRPDDAHRPLGEHSDRRRQLPRGDHARIGVLPTAPLAIRPGFVCRHRSADPTGERRQHESWRGLVQSFRYGERRHASVRDFRTEHLAKGSGTATISYDRISGPVSGEFFVAFKSFPAPPPTIRCVSEFHPLVLTRVAE